MVLEETQLEQREDGELVLRARSGCRDAFDVLARRYRAGISLIARPIVGDAARAEDVAQDALVIAMNALPTLAHPAQFGPWLGAITRHRARRVVRQEGRFLPLEPAHLERLPTAPNPIRDDLTEALADLGEDYWIVLRLRYWEEWSVAQIAAFLSLPITTVKWRLHYARELLRRRLSKNEKETINGQCTVVQCQFKASEAPAGGDHRSCP
ncbi:MAG: sigma-70 family RNA polymerase sigma factor [Capsulimonas sp.]|uniref:RNA polymerase sigma factor n=1 Tax=Capsulimonas sp. TaxID=2494211 RepID=UPI0032648BF2